jgi:hypothetical protein
MTAAAMSALVKASTVGISLEQGREGDGAACLLWRGPRGAMTEDLNTDLTANKGDFLEHFKAGCATVIMAAVSSAYDHLGKSYLHAENYQQGNSRLERFLSALTAWESRIYDAIAALASLRSENFRDDCGAESPVTVPTTLGQLICSACARTDAIAVRRAGPQRRLSP